jgi:hypothetical protein
MPWLRLKVKGRDAVVEHGLSQALSLIAYQPIYTSLSLFTLLALCENQEGRNVHQFI